MKKILLAVGALFLFFVLLGCDENGSFSIPTDVTIPTSEEETTEEPSSDDLTTVIPTVTEDESSDSSSSDTSGDTSTDTSTETSEDTEPVVLLDRPRNLSIDSTTKILSWDPVTDAVEYQVYVDGDLQTTVTTSQYDF